MRTLDRGAVRHFIMRAGLGLVLGWFGIQELRSPTDWIVFVPSFVSDHSPIAVQHLVTLHGFLLVLAAASVVLGLLYVFGCLLAMGLISEILLSLWLDGGVSDIVIRDLGLLALAGALALDPVRSWGVESVLPLLSQHGRVSRRTEKTRKRTLSRQPGWRAYASAAAVLAVAVLALALVLRATDGGPSLTSASVVSSSSIAASPSPEPSAAATPGATPTVEPSSPAASSTRFDDWPYKRFAFQLYPGDISSQTERALAGFQLSVQDEGNKVRLALKALSSRYHDAEVVIDKGNTAYFIETSMGDDPNGLESNLGDDGIIVVNPQGYILRS